MKPSNIGELLAKLQQFYNDHSKHANYQNIPEFVKKAIGYSETINEEWRGDTARYNYILKEIDFPVGAVVGDIGANTGFFTLSLSYFLQKAQFIAYEANLNHAEHINLIKDYFQIDNILIKNKMIDINDIISLPNHDILLHMNVLHHAGYDFDKHLNKTLKDFEAYALEYLAILRPKTTILVFQMGSNWGGSKMKPIIPPDHDTEKIRFISRILLRAGWRIRKIAMATRDADKNILYRNLPDEITDRINNCVAVSDLKGIVKEYKLEQFVGEFYRRPFFICESGS